MDITDFIGKLAPTLEKYAMAENKPAFIQALQEGFQKTSLKLLSAPYNPELKKEMIQSGIPSGLVLTLVERKMFHKVFEAKNSDQIKEEIENLKKMYRLNFQHPRPMQANIQEGNQFLPQQHDFEAKLETDETIQTFLLRKLKESENNIQYISDYGIRLLPEELILKLKPAHKQNILRRSELINTFNDEFLIKLILTFCQESKKNQQVFQLPSYIVNCLTVSQLNLLAERQPAVFNNSSFSSKYFRSNYEQQFQFLKTQNKWLPFEEKEQKRQILHLILERIRSIDNIALIDYENQIFLELMIVDLSIEDPDVERYVTYLKMLRQPVPLLNKDYREDLMRKRAKPYIMHSGQLESAKLGMGKFSEDYLIALLNKYQIQKLDPILLKYLDQELYFQTKARVLLKKGESLGILQKVLSENEKASIAESKYITLIDKNKNKFKVDEDVILSVKVKNVRDIKVKIYELNLQKHYLETFSEIEDTMSLNYLEPTSSFIYENLVTNKYKQSIYDIKIDKVKKQRGIYVVDLEGDGVSSRAVVRKGCVFCFKRMTLAGVELKFYNEEGQKLENVDLWIKGKKVQVKNSYIVPFSENRQNLDIIVLVGSYAELININIPAEDYILDVFCIYNQQTFIVGNKAKIILHPRLSIKGFSDRQNREQISLKLLKNIKVKVEIQNSLDIKSSLNFENVDWTSKEDYVLEFPIQSYIKNVNVMVDAEIKKYNGKKQQVAFRKRIDIDLRDSMPMFIDFYLNKKNEEYILNVLGKNGEPVPNFSVTLTYLQKAFKQTEQKSLKSDQEGKISLGKMKIVNSLALTTNLETSNHLKTWAISNPKLEICLLDKMSFKEDETVLIPIPENSLNLETDICILKVIKKTYLENCTKKAKVNGRYLQIDDLKEGIYIIKFFTFEHEVKLTVLKGKQWEQTNQLYNQKKEIVYELNRSSNHYLCLGESTVEEGANDNKINVKIVKPENAVVGEGVKAHVLVTNYISPSHLDDILPPENNQYRDVKINKFQHKYNTYYSDKKLSEEESYILNRKNEKQFIGNNMEKPHVFLNRIKVRDTTQKDQQLEQGENYKKKLRGRASKLEEDVLDFHEEKYIQAHDHLVLPNTAINAHNNFLAYGGLTIDNIKGDTIEFNLPKSYSNYSIVLISNNSCIKKNYSIHSDVSKKPISHPGIKDQNQKLAWTMSREIYPLQKGEEIKINRDSKWCAVSLINVINFAKLRGVNVEDWVLGWNHYEEDKKLQLYNKKICHELNCFIKHHDEAFFQKVVKSYIQNKIHKTFVDLCLLESDECLKWTENQYSLQLNDFERVLLVEYLMKKKKVSEAERIANSIILREKTRKEPFKVYKKHFDTVISAKMIEEQLNQPPPPPPPQYAMQRMQKQNPMDLLDSGFAMQKAMFGSGGPPPPPGMAFGGFGGVPPRPQAPQANLFGMAASGIQQKLGSQIDMFGFEDDALMEDEQELLQIRETYQKPFKAVEKTEEYTEITYSEVKNAQKTENLVPNSQFWADLAHHLTHNPEKQFVSQSFMYLLDKVSFTLAACFLPSSPNALFEIKNEGQNFIISAKSTFLVFVKEIKEVDYQSKFGIMINHRFFDPYDQFHYEDDGLKVEKEVEEFVIHRQYSLQTVITNTSGTNLELQLLVDIPEGSIPLLTQQYTQIINTTVPAFSTKSFNRIFYFPEEGKYSFYPSNACWDKTVIAKALKQQLILVKKQPTMKNLKSFTDVIRSGTEEEIIAFLKEKNIFDPNMFVSSQILWMLKSKETYQKIIALLKERGYYSQEIWEYAFYHGDIPNVQEYLEVKMHKNPSQATLSIFEYYPYYSTRTHKFLNQNKTTIRNVEFKQTYFKFLLDSFVEKNYNSCFKLSLAYYLLLQDRIDEASKCFQMMSAEERSNHQLQVDYFECFLNMYEDYPNFSKARKLTQQYVDYPVIGWRNLFKEIHDTLKDYDSTICLEPQSSKIQYKTAVFNEGEIIRVNVPPKTKVQVLLFPMNLELYFSDAPFERGSSFSAVKADKVIVYEKGDPREERIKREENMKDIMVEVYATGENLPSRKITSFLWTNPKIKLKLNENKGNLQLFYEGKQVPGAYCKVYSAGVKGEKFYRDGYTDITGTFKYALTDLDEVSEFSILAVTDKGGVKSTVAPPSESGYLDY